MTMTQTYSVMLVDDEEYILEGLTNVIEWERAGFRVDCTARNGKEALRLLETRPLDLVITDVRMPFVDGIALIKAVSERHPSVKTIIVSGYGDFEYARQAIQYGAVGYILKPTRNDELYAALRKVKALMDDTQVMREATVQVHRQAEHNVKYKLEAALRELLLYGKKEAASLVGAWMPSAQYGICLIKDYCEENMPVFSAMLGQFGEKPSAPDEGGCIALQNDGFVTLFLAAGSALGVHRLAQHIWDAIRERGKLLSSEPALFAALVCPLAGPEAAHRAYKLACERLQYTFQARDGMIAIHPEELAERQDALTGAGRAVGAKERQSAAHGDQLEAFVNGILLADQAEGAALVIDEFIGNLQQRFVPYGEIRTAARALLDALWRTAEAYVDNYGPDTLPDAGAMNHIYTFERLAAHLKEHVFNLIRFLLEHHVNYFTRVTHLIYKYVEEHYRENVKLDEAARSVALSTSYFCFIFKKETGLTFMEYLTRYRLNKAKQLLTETELKVYEVAEKVGYVDAKHFMKQFKRMYGVKPGEFRKI